MRWNGQQVGEHGVGAEQTLPGLDGLLRTVRTPEFAGVVFHEVEARSALNRVPGSSPMPFRWTVNPYRGCAHACVYCLAGPTRVLLADGTTRPIADLRVGDIVLGNPNVAGVSNNVGAGFGGGPGVPFEPTVVLKNAVVSWDTICFPKPEGA